jgi:hypothetical protein
VIRVDFAYVKLIEKQIAIVKEFKNKVRNKLQQNPI